MYKLEITKIHCTEKGGDAAHDDLMILVQTDAGPPNRFPLFSSEPMGKGDDYSPGAVYYYSNTAYISIWDRDGALNFCDASDMLGSTWVGATPTNNGVATVRGDQGASYKIYYTVTAQQPAANDNGTSLDAAFIQAINDDLTAWAASSLGQQVISTTDPSDLEDLLKEALLSTAFSKVAAKIKSEEKVKAVSLGVMASAEIFAGITGAFGVAINRSDFQFVGMSSDPDQVTSSIFAGGGFVEGVEDGIQGTLALGIWFEDAGEISGFYVGEEIDVDDGLGVTAVALAGRDDKDDFKDEEGNVVMDKAKVLYVGIDVGIADGTEAEELYYFSGTMSQMPVSQSGDYNHMAILDDLHCHDALSPDNVDEGEKDHVYIEYTVDDEDTVYRYPIWNTIEMAEGGGLDHWTCGNAIKFNNSFTVSLYVGTSSAKNSQAFIQKQTYSKNSFPSDGDLDYSFKDKVGTHKVDYHLHAKLQY